MPHDEGVSVLWHQKHRHPEYWALRWSALKKLIHETCPFVFSKSLCCWDLIAAHILEWYGSSSRGFRLKRVSTRGPDIHAAG